MQLRLVIAILLSLLLWETSRAENPKLLLDARNCKTAFGWQRPILYGAALMDKATRTFPDEKVQRCAREHNIHVPAILDIEEWEMPQERDKLIAVVKTWRKASPKKKFGLYSYLPIRNYWAPIKEYEKQSDGPKLMQEWIDNNALMQSVAEHIDYIFPSLYTFYDTPQQRPLWDVYAKANIDEAKKYGKPVYPFIWPRIHPGGKDVEPKPMDKEFFEHQLQWCYDNCDGVVVWDWVAKKPDIDPTSIMTTEVMNNFAISRFSKK